MLYYGCQQTVGMWQESHYHHENLCCPMPTNVKWPLETNLVNKVGEIGVSTKTIAQTAGLKNCSI